MVTLWQLFQLQCHDSCCSTFILQITFLKVKSHCLAVKQDQFIIKIIIIHRSHLIRNRKLSSMCTVPWNWPWQYSKNNKITEIKDRTDHLNHLSIYLIKKLPFIITSYNPVSNGNLWSLAEAEDSCLMPLKWPD